ncbi:DNA excision repair protein ERCC-1 isoform X2 [Rhinatrema bivittatum]|uniref:DNA excision repair protein ERCC-1 isoform X2 n=1 Tax=Rhinatrema bivittatum TaxID=194408 RepID=UPI001126DF81|nr:DNA excision repair protein ERCC-1 isoform X2 [Rhinatrema bivittatum]XP_029430774.1 DNA excision repair protein ERCC-1 isoform X2 [Rhinatrema bivittatum]XP_029430775.1 DNA excision repair protein ERCC-1 isoform X2 [Rhinatrema bivittatum]
MNEPVDLGEAPERKKRFIIPSQDTDSTPLKPLFKSSVGCEGSARGAVAPKLVGTYADYIFKQDAGPSALQPGSQTEGGSRKGAACADRPVQLGTVQSAEAGGAGTVTGKPAGKSNCILVSPRQRGNPILKFVRNVPWEFDEITPDYVMGQTTCALFLSLRYHNLNPNYIHERLKKLGQTYALRVLLVQVDVKDPHFALKELAKICILADCTLILAWSPEEAGRYLETYKSYEQKPADVLKEKVEQDFLSKMTDCLTTIKSVNKTDSLTLISTFESLADLAKASREDLSLCPGLGPQKAKRLFDVLHEPFRKMNK